MLGPEKIDFSPERQLESQESPAREKWTKQASDLLKKFWFASLVVAIPSVVEGKEPVKFEDVWKILTSGRDNPADLNLTIINRSSNREESARYLRAYRAYNARMDSILKVVPLKEVGEYLESFGVDFGSVTPYQKEYRFLPVHDEGSSVYASMNSFKEETGKKGNIEINTAKMSPTDTLLVEMVSVHEIGHFIRQRGFVIRPPVIEEGLANWGTWKFMKDYLSKQGLSNQEIKSRLGSVLNIGYNGETLLAAMLDYLHKDKNLLKAYYGGESDFPVYESIEWTHEKLTGIIRRDIYTKGTLGPYEVMNLLQYLIANHGLHRVKEVYKKLESDYFIDITKKNIGSLKWERNITCLDKTIDKPPLRTEGELYLLTPNGVIVNLAYDPNGMRQYQDILFQLQENLRTPEVSFIRLPVHLSISLKEKDGSLRKEIKDILDPKIPEMMAKN